MLKTEMNVITKYSEVMNKNISFEEYFINILKSYEKKELILIFYCNLLLYD